MMNAMHTLTDNTFDQRSSGFSMVELMVAMTISLLLMAGVVQIFGSSKASYVMQEGTSRLQENARFTLGRLSHDISAAGYLGCLDSANPVRPFTNDLSDKTAASGYDFATPLFGTEGTGANGSDTISISRASATTGIRLTAGMDTEISDLQLDATDNAYQALEQFDILAVGDCGTASVFMITNDPTTSGGLIQHASGVAAVGGPNNGQSNLTGDLGAVYGADRASVAGAYRVGTTTYLLCPSPNVPGGTSLFLDNCNNPTNELVEGVQRMEFNYGVDTNLVPGADEYLDAGQVTAANRWNSVVSVRMTLDFDSIQNIPGGALVKPFTTTVRVRNRGG
jgi:type IV pilus assembly protein PilW